ncbi:MAG: hypothetical protein JJE23_15125, partial [Thermoleophilia bacterium]|nr:hypothetical protein [Thermoleophilia bacterium]
VLIASVAAVAAARMQSERLGQGLCETVGGGRFVDIPGFPGEQIDRRLRRDVAMIVRRYDVFITDGYSTDAVHSKKGEHPIGLALDIVPNTANGGRWRDVGRLARWAEPEQDKPRAPFRWVGYNGDRGHGRGNHLHLSWAHSVGKSGKPARTVYSVRCPKAGDPNAGGSNPGKGGVSPGRGSSNDQRLAGGISFRHARKSIRRQQRGTASRERGGIGLD